ncbi:MAG: hypothetical protein GY783_06295 [Gammaproteobacteria bacterium]|nr:hypothetical protein [Gammaproteobacteria bacterium]
MNTKLFQMRNPGLALLVLLSACSGGGINVSIDGPVIPPLPVVQTSEAITAHGAITGLGGVTINDVRYTTNAATLTVNGEPGTLSELSHGQIVTVRGRINSDGWSGTADSILYDANLIGPVENLDASNNRLTVMGQTVIVDSATLFGSSIDPATLAGLSIGSIVQLSGYVDAAGAIRATRIDPDNANADLQIIGKVTGLDIGNLLFSINRLTVDYSGAVFIDLPSGAPTDGMMVKAIGTLSGRLFVVERLVTAPGLVGNNGQRVQTAGLITRFNTSSDFDVNNSAARTNTGTAFLNGDAGDLALNAELVIDGDFDAVGRITANRVTFGRLVNETAILAFDFSNFTDISVLSVFKVTVIQGPEYSVEVTVDADIVNNVQVTQTGATVSFELLPGNNNAETLEAVVTMPVLNRIDTTANAVAHVTLRDFNQMQMMVNVGGVSYLRGEGLMIRDLTSTVSGVSWLDFGDIRPIANANIDVGGVSQATLNMDVGSTLTGSVGTGQGTGVSTLFYYGTNVNVNVATDGLSRVTRLGDTKP